MNEVSIKKAAFINFTSKYANLLIQIIYNAVLSRILTPEDFGIVAVTSVFVTFFMLFANMGLGTAIIQNKTLCDEEINDIFSFTVYLAIALAIIFQLFSIPLSIFYENRIYIKIGILLSIALFFNTLNMIPNAILRKNKKFLTIAIRLIVVTIISGVLTIIFAYMGMRYYSIVLHSIFMAIFTFIWNYKSTNLKFKYVFNKSSILKVTEFSMFQFGFNLINYFSRNLDSLFIGKYLGNISLAYYDKSYKLMLYPVNNLTNIITPVLHPILSEYQDDKRYIFNQYIKIVKILSLLGAFISPFCFFTAKEIILILYGEQWSSAVLSFQILALCIWVQMISSSSGSIFQSLGNTKLLFINGIITSSITVSAIMVGIFFKDINKVAFCVALAYNLHFFITYYVLIRHGFQYKLIIFMKNLIPDVIIFLINFIGLFFISQIKIENVLVSLLFKTILGSGVYILSLLITKQYNYFLPLIKNLRH